MNREIKSTHAVGIIVSFVIVLALLITGYLKIANFSVSSLTGEKNPDASRQKTSELTTLKRFDSEADFKQYLEKSRELSEISTQFSLGGLRNGFTGQEMQLGVPAPTDMKSSGPNIGSAAPQRVSETNVQVAGIDEPDIVKTDGKEIFFSSQPLWGDFRPMPISDIEGRGPDVIPNRNTGIRNIRAFPVDDLKLDGRIEKEGQLLVRDRLLFVLPASAGPDGSETNSFRENGNKIFAYDVSDPAAPKEKWNAELQENNQLVSARLLGDKIFIVTRKQIDEGHPCAFEPLTSNGKPLSVGCGEIFHPVTPVPADVIYTVSAFDAASGTVKDMTSFVGSSAESVVYMSGQSIYITYYYPGDFVGFSAGFFKENRDLIPEWLIERIERVMNYDLSGRAKQAELEDALTRFQNSLSADEKKRVENELRNRMEDYFARHKRELEKTGIVKINAQDLTISASGLVSGKPLNQFSLDEYQGNLRVATTVGSGWWGLGFGGARDSANDVYVLDKELRHAGSIIDLGIDERIYSARFIEDKGYLVTFRQTDPFFVLDLADPQNPQKKGELKIPGFSSYLHPLKKDRILGVGEEDGQVKLSLFDVSDATNPKEIAKYHLEEFYSEIAQTHHAYLQDPKHQVFFLPGSQGAYVFSYEGDNLKLARAVSDIAARRAVYINDNLYIIGDDKIAVLNEVNWEKMKELEF